MSIYLLDKTLQVDIFYECEDHDLEDNICISIVERCPPGEQLLRAGETHLYLTPDEARQAGQALLAAVEKSESNKEH
ncbi:MAG: hypothetical protein SVT56_01180 [Chloroflexota bacterium]|jgi:hypothetical protein|nr:hypothetical protein [Chloroflexota bacterium]